MNLDQLESRLRRMSGNPPESNVDKSVFYEYVNEGYMELCDRVNFREVRSRLRFPASLGVNLYKIPQEWYAILRVRANDVSDRSWALEKVGPSLSNFWDNSGSQGRPMAYRLVTQSIQLYPVPDSTYTIELFARFRPNPMTLPDDIPIIPASWHTGIAMLGRWLYFDLERNDLPKANAALAAYNTWAAGKSKPFQEELDDVDHAVNPRTLGDWAGRESFSRFLPTDLWRSGPWGL